MQEGMTMSDQTYTLNNLDGPLFRQQRAWLINTAAVAAHALDANGVATFQLTKADVELLDGLVELTDAIADQAHDRYGIDCLLEGGEDA